MRENKKNKKKLKDENERRKTKEGKNKESNSTDRMNDEKKKMVPCKDGGRMNANIRHLRVRASRQSLFLVDMT